ncbi:MAG: imidazole glycerol phosphate synthase subunit HisH [Endomicrobia bacterium]|nr:imidazole glycerol phosphate synthase subunit HisH [Endomicrobiia bacterium]
MNKKIAVIDYGFGNIKSVVNALKYCGAKPEVIGLPHELSEFNGAVLPGVGSFGPAADFLKISGFDKTLCEYTGSGKMLFGICLGFQLFFTKGYENGEHDGLNLIAGSVKKFSFENDRKSEFLKIPHMGWNSLELSKTLDAQKMFKGIKDGETFYFVHSYYAQPENKEQASSFCNYGVKFCSSVAYKNIWGSQFHPEKSGDKGLIILNNFINEVK